MLVESIYICVWVKVCMYVCVCVCVCVREGIEIKSLYKHVKYLYSYTLIVRLNSLKYYQLIQITINHNSPRIEQQRIEPNQHKMKWRWQ